METTTLTEEKKPRGRPPKKQTAFGAWLAIHPDWTKAKMAASLGQSEPHIRNLCNGNRIPNRVLALAIAHVTKEEFPVERWEKISEDS